MIETPRLILRQWREADRAAFAAMNADPRVMAHMPALLMRDQSDALMNRLGAAIAATGAGMWAIERRSDRAWLGFCGVQPVTFDCPARGGHEIGWRLARAHWGAGYATEAATAAMAHAFGAMDLARMHTFTVPDNWRSQAVMTRISMVPAPELDFEHPNLPPGHRLRRHVMFLKDR